MTSTSERTWYLDSSVALRALLGHSRAAADWYDERCDNGDVFISSRLLHLEMTRVLRRDQLPVSIVDDFVDELTLLTVDDVLVDEARAIQPHIKSLNAIHLASALRVGTENLTVATHDSNMRKVAELLGFEVHDPVTD
ncbi:type II toxin-antitoxin system VapC family toxin [Nocardioides sp. NBC_00368]|uniref:type II toxin-antitoxin system VapC family toxin n=1 Tax=Nocardioides sp. NBC_00368 TaxID=2976000 RepID=UPI002E225439